MPDAIFAHPRLAPAYDAFDGDRDDLNAYLAIADELDARVVLDLGCGTGNLALLLARHAFRYTYRFLTDGVTLTSDSTLRFRDRDEVEASLASTGYRVTDVREAPDRPDREFVFVAHRVDPPLRWKAMGGSAPG